MRSVEVRAPWDKKINISLENTNPEETSKALLREVRRKPRKWIHSNDDSQQQMMLTSQI
jgi:hypothetical protein